MILRKRFLSLHLNNGHEKLFIQADGISFSLKMMRSTVFVDVSIETSLCFCRRSDLATVLIIIVYRILPGSLSVRTARWSDLSSGFSLLCYTYKVWYLCELCRQKLIKDYLPCHTSTSSRPHFVSKAIFSIFLPFLALDIVSKVSYIASMFSCIIVVRICIKINK